MSATILVVDDEPLLRSSLSRALTDEGYTVLTAADGLEALLLLQRSPVDLRVCDVVMPLVNGLDLVDELRERGNLTPVLLMSVLDCPPCHHPAVRCLDKPFELDTMSTAVRELLAPPPPARVVAKRFDTLGGYPR
jgi:two-component system, OmpR family, response regulator MprA